MVGSPALSARLAAVFLALLSVLALAAGPAAATLYVAVDDGELADRSTLIVEGRVLAAEAAAGERPAIDYRVQVERRLKGEPGDGALTVRIPGGVGADGRGLALAGAPRLDPGDEVLLFLVPGNDGTTTPQQLFLGTFQIADEDGRKIARRDAWGAVEVAGNEDRRRRDLARFRRFLAARARGERPAADYFLPPPPGAEAKGFAGDRLAKWQPLVSSREPPPRGCGADGGRALRWFDFDGGGEDGGSGGAVAWRSHFGGQRGLPGGGVAELSTALAAWTDDPHSAVALVYAGLTDAEAGLAAGDGTNAVLYGDPGGQIPGTFDGGGLLALAGAWFRCDLVTRRGVRYHPIVEADLVTQDGIERFFAASRRPRKAAEELFAHELGHTLGFAHSADPEALMFDVARDDGRGAALDVDDLAGLLALYGRGDGLDPPAAPAALAAEALSATRVRLTWDDRSDDESNFRLERRSDGDFALIAAVAGQNDFVDAALAPETDYAYRVRAQNGAGGSPYSAEAAVRTLPDLRPAPPSNLRAAPLASRRARLAWQDNSDDETSFALSFRDPRSGAFVEIPYAIPPDTTVILISELDPATDYAFQVRARNAFGTSGASNTATVTTFADDAGCVAGGPDLCLLGGRFRLRLTFVDPRPGGGERTATAVPSTDQTGLFWFFSADNIELIVKMLDGRALNGHFWLYYGGVSDLEYRLEISDTTNGRTAVYHNPAGTICGFADTLAFRGETAGGPTLATSPQAVPALDPAAPALTPDRRPAASLKAEPAAGSCVPGGESLCLLERRLRVEVRWRNPRDGGEGVGQAVFGSDNSGYFWFFDPQNTELVVKALDGGALNRHLWVFYGALTDLETWITVTDTAAGRRRVYYNPPGKICGRADVEAFPTAGR